MSKKTQQQIAATDPVYDIIYMTVFDWGRMSSAEQEGFVRIGLGNNDKGFPPFPSLGFRGATYREFMKVRDCIADANMTQVRQEIATSYLETVPQGQLTYILEQAKSGKLAIGGWNTRETQDVRMLLAIALYKKDPASAFNAKLFRTDGKHVPLLDVLFKAAEFWGVPLA